MSVQAIGAFLAVLAVVFLLGNLWFRLVEAILSRISGVFLRCGKPPAWHPLPSDGDGEKGDG